MNLFARFFVILLAFALIPVFIIGTWIFSSTAAVRDNAIRMHQQITQLTAETAGSFLMDVNRALSFVADLEANVRKDPGTDFRIIQRAAANHSALILVSLLDPAAKETIRLADPQLYPSAVFENRASDPAIQEMRKTDHIAIGHPFRLKDRTLLPIAHPLPDGRALYVLYAIEPLLERVNRLSVGASGRMFLVDGAGKPLPGLREDFPTPKWDAAPGNTLGWLDNIQTTAGTMVGAYAPIPSLNAWALSLQPKAEAFSHSDSFIFQVGAFLLLLSIGASLGAYWITGRLTKPLNLLIAGAHRASENDFSRPVPEVGWGELKVLASDFNKMMETLREYQGLQVERIMEERARVTALVHNIPDGIIMAGFNGEIVYTNAVAGLMLGSGDIKTWSGPRTLRDAITSPQLRDLALSLIQRKKRADSLEVELLGRDGASRGVFMCQGVTVSGDRRDIGILLMLRDVTMERNLEKMKEEFLHSIVHDLRSPLAAIGAFIETMQKSKNLEERERTYMRYATQAAQRLKDLVADILQMAKLESGTLELKKAPIEAKAILDSMRDLYAIQAEPRKIQLGFQLGPPPHSVNCDGGLIERVVMNLIGNAMKFTPEGGRIQLAVGAVGGEMEFSVQDTGPGIPKAGLKTIFEKFKQLDSAQGHSGYGLGLAICKKIVDLHGGRIWVESEEGTGSRFIFRLPLN